MSTVATSGSYNDLINKPTLPSSTSPLPINSGGTGANNKEDACTNLGAAKQYYMQKGLSKEGWYRIGLLTAVMSTSSARIVVGGTNADVSPIIMDFQHNFKGNMLSQMPTVMTPLYVTKVRACRYTSDDMYIDVYFTNIASSVTTVSVFPLEGTFEPMDFKDVTGEAVSVATSIDVLKDGFLTGRLTSEDVSDVAISGSYNDLLDKPTIQDVSGKLDKTEAASTYMPLSGGSLTDGATLTLSQYGSRSVTITGNNIIADMSKDTGTWAGTFASVKDPVGDEITMLGWYGKTTGLIHIFMGGDYLNPAMKMTKDGMFTFMYNPKVGDKTIATNEDVASIYAAKTELNNKQDKILKLENKTASLWVSDNTYTDYPYRCDISCDGVTADMFAEVVFNVNEAVSGDYAPICETKSNIVSIWSSKNETITIPTILITK